MNRPSFLLVAFVVGLMSLTGAATRSFAQRPPASRLLPHDTLAYVRVASVPEARETFTQTALGRMLQDPQLQPLLNRLYGELTASYAQVQEQVNASWSELLTLPQGEVCIALVGRPEGNPALVLLIDVGKQPLAARRIIDARVQALREQGWTESTESLSGTEAKILMPPGDRTRQIVIAEKEGAMLLASQVDTAQAVLARWNGEATEDRTPTEKTLADNADFIQLMNRCLTPDGSDPQLTWYVNPVELAHQTTRGNPSAQAGLALLPVLGLDGWKAIGGSWAFVTEDVENLVQITALVEQPRTGVLDLIALQDGTIRPESWVPGSSASYSTVHWDAQQTYDALQVLYDGFRGQGALEAAIERSFNERWQIDLRRDLIDQFAGRLTYLTWIEKPLAANSERRLLAAQVRDPEQFEQLLEHLADVFAEDLGDRLESQTFGGLTYYRFRDTQGRGEQAREYEICGGVLDDYFVLTDSSRLLHELVTTQSDPSSALAAQLDFKLVSSQIEMLTGTTTPAGFSYTHPEENVRLLYATAADPQLRQQWQGGPQNQPLRVLGEALEQHPLPPFAAIAQYLAPGGAVLLNDRGGWHYVRFTLRRR